MADKNSQEKKADSKVENLPNKPVTTDKAGQVKGGRARSGGDDDDLEELEVQR
jgi:hypothetical protein